MKTTVDISTPLFERAKIVARDRGVTLRALIEQGLRQVIESDREIPRFQLRDESINGNGLQARVEDDSWERVREMVYEGRGG